MAEKKITKREVLNYMLKTYANDTKVVEYATHEIELLDNKKNATSEKDKEKKAQRESDKQLVLNALVELGTYATLKEINAVEELKDYSNQKLTNLLTEMLNTDKSVERKVEKRVAYYKAV